MEAILLIVGMFATDPAETQDSLSAPQLGVVIEYPGRTDWWWFMPGITTTGSST